MKTLTKFAVGAALAAGLSMTAVPASAGVHVGVGIGAPVVYTPAHRHWCARHPHKCRHGAAVVVAPRIGVFYTGRGWWDGHRYWAHRRHYHGHWRYY